MDREIIVADGRQFLSQLWQVLDGFVNAVVSDIIGGRLGAQAQVIADILLDKAIGIMAADDRIGQADIFYHGLKLTFVLFGNLAAKDDGDLVGPADPAISIQEPSPELIERCPAIKNQIVTIFDLGEEKPLLAASGFCVRSA